MHSLPALTTLRKGFPDAQISWMIRPEFAPLIENHPDLTKTIIFDRRFLGKSWYNPKAFTALISLIKQLRAAKYDLIVDLQGLFRTGCLAWLSGCKKRIGLSEAREFARYFYTDKVSHTQKNIHMVDCYLSIVGEIGIQRQESSFVLAINPRDSDSVDKLLRDNKVDQHNYAVLIPGSAHADKCWPVENFARIAERIHNEFGLYIISSGTASEKIITDKLKTVSKVPIVDFAGLTSLGELVSLIKGAQLVVSNDTGPGHIAAVLNVPLVMIFGRANPARVGPYKREDCIVAVEPFSRGFKANSKDPKYHVGNVTIEQVYDRVCQQLKDQKLTH
ncbi:MAG: glycosyltransferase family 9 protein [Planctomycetota bacterium]